MAFTIYGQTVSQTAGTTDADLSALVTLINGIATVARSTAYTVGQVVRPPAANGFMYRCSVAGTTAASAPTFGTTEAGTTVDGTATFVAHEQMQAMTTGSGSDLYRIVSLGSFRIYCAGALTVNGATPELLAFGTKSLEVNLEVNNTGNFTLGRRTTLNSTTRSEQRIGGLYFAGNHSQHWTGRAIDIYGVFNWYGDIQAQTCPIRTNTGGSVVVRDAYWACRAKVSAYNVQSLWFHAGGTADIDGFRIEGSASFTRTGTGVVTNFLNVVPFQADSTNQNETSTSPFDIYGFNPQGCVIDFGWWMGAAQTRGIRSYDSPRGTNLYCGDADSAVAEVGWVEMWRRVKAKAVDPANTAISGAVMYVRDTNNGNRGAASAVTGTGAAAGTTVTARNVNYLATDGLTLGADRIYIQTTAADGTTPQFNLLIGGCAAEVAVGRPGYDVGASRIDRRGKTDVAASRTNTDAFDLHLWSYGHQYTKISDYSMAGSGIATPQAAMLLDASVTLTQAQAAALTSIATLDNLYDATKNWKCQATKANLEYPTIGTALATASGTILDLGSRHLVIDGTAASAFAINTGTNTITIKSSALAAGTKFKSLKTTGSVTFANGGSITTPYTDTSGTRVTLKDASGIPLSTRVVVNGTTDLGVVVNATERYLFVQPTDVVRIYATGYGYKQRLYEITGNTASDYVISLIADPHVDTGLSTTIRDQIAAHFAFGVDGSSNVFMSTDADLRAYSPAEVANAFSHYVFLNPTVLAMALMAYGTPGGDLPVDLGDGSLIVKSPLFYGKVADSVTTVNDLGIYIPFFIDVDPAVYVAVPTYTPVRKNSSGILLSSALWTKQSADISTADKADIRNGLALQASLQIVNQGVQKASLLVPHTEAL